MFSFSLFGKEWLHSSIVSAKHTGGVKGKESTAPIDAALAENLAAVRMERDGKSGGPKAPLATTRSSIPDTAEMKRVFDKFDENKDGVICSGELSRYMKRLGFVMTEEEVVALVKTVDENCDGSVNFDEFYSLYVSLSGSETTTSATHSNEQEDHDLFEAFQVFDKNNDGFITVQELQSVLVSLGMVEGSSLKKCYQMIQNVDSDGNGQVDFNEFKLMMSSDLFNEQPS